MIEHPHVYTTREEARRIVGKLYDTIFLGHQPSCTITTEEYAALRNCLAKDRPEVSFTPGRPLGIVAVAFGGDVIV